MRQKLGLLTVLFLLKAAMVLAHPTVAPNRPAWQAATSWPDRIIVSPGAMPQTELSLSWRTDATVTSSVAELVKASADSRFDILATTYPAKYERVDLNRIKIAASRSGTPNEGLGPVHYHSVVVKDLEPNTLYAYRVRGERGQWSEWFQTRTAPETGPITFLYYGDAQYGILSHAARIFRQGLLSVPEARFILHAGDLVNKGDRDSEWGEWFKASGFIHAMIPTLPVAGNHEYLATAQGGTKDGKGILTPLWRPQFTLPIVSTLPEALHETVYDMRLSNDLHVFILDSSSPHWTQQMDWLIETSARSDARWKIVGMHHSPFRPGIQGYVKAPERGAYHRARQTAFIAAAKAAKIDLILAGHNHSYTRSAFGAGVGPGLPNENARQTRRQARAVEMVILVSISGAMSGTMTPQRYAANQAKFGKDIALERWANNTPTYQAVRIEGSRLAVTSYLATGEVYDAFQLDEQPDGTVMMTNLDAAFGPTRNFETTGPYKDKNDLR